MKDPNWRRTLITFIATLSAVFVPVCTAVAAQEPREERVLEDKIPAHVPIKVKVKNLQNEHWARDLEVEVRNTGSRPIYCVNFFILLPDTQSPGGSNPIGFGFRYGRHALVSFREPLIPEDIPLMPGEAHTFKISEPEVKFWERNETKSEPLKPKKFRVMLSVLNFGDGTGFLGTGGAPIPDRSGASAPCPPKRPDGAAGAGATNALRSYLKRGGELLAGKILTGKFFPRRNGGREPEPSSAPELL